MASAITIVHSLLLQPTNTYKMTLLRKIIINSSDEELNVLLENYKTTLSRESEVLTEPTKILLRDKIDEITQELLERNY